MAQERSQDLVKEKQVEFSLEIANAFGKNLRVSVQYQRLSYRIVQVVKELLGLLVIDELSDNFPLTYHELGVPAAVAP